LHELNTDNIVVTLIFMLAGNLSAPSNFFIVALNLSTVHLRWTAPFSLNVTSNTVTQPSIFGYSIHIKNESEGSLIFNSTVNEFFYTVEDAEDLVCVAGLNVVGIGQYTESLAFSLACKCINSTVSMGLWPYGHACRQPGLVQG
jgi:hypothetical protein